MVVVAHGFSDEVLTQLAFNFANPLTINIVPMITPMAGFLNSQLHFLHDLSAFTGAAVFGMSNQVADATIDHLGKNAESFESYRFRSTVIAHPNADDIELRVSDLKTQKQNAESALERSWLEERLGKLTSGIAKLTIYGASGGELKEAHDRCEDAVCAVRAAISKGALPGGCRIAIDLAQICAGLNNRIAEDVLIPALMSLPARLLDNAGHNSEEIESVVDTLLASTDSVYDVENQKFGRAEDLGIFDALPAVEEAIKNAIGIAGVMGTMGGIVAYPRDEQFERSEASADREFERAVNDPHSFKNEANERP
jgi:chaperonin GroEL